MDKNKKASKKPEEKQPELEPEAYCDDCKTPIYNLDSHGYKCECTDEWYCQICYMTGEDPHINHKSDSEDDF